MYDMHWGLTGRPFQLTPDPRFWFETATHRKAMAYLGYGLAQGEGFIVITGDVGAGKTTLVGHLLDTLDREHVAPIKIVSTAIQSDDLLRIVAGQLGVVVDGLPKAQLLTAIERKLHAVARGGRRTLLIVDEAQALPVSALEELRMLSNFQAGGHALLQIVLLGQPEFRDRLHGSERLDQLRQRVIAIHHLDPMESHEVADYIAHRLSVVGWAGKPDFAADAFPAFFRGSAGVPRRLNLLAGRVMLFAAVENLSMIDARVVEMVMDDLHSDLPTTGHEPAAPAAAVERPVPLPPVTSPVVEVVQPQPKPTSMPQPATRAVPPQVMVSPVPVASTTPVPAAPVTPPPATAAASRWFGAAPAEPPRARIAAGWFVAPPAPTPDFVVENAPVADAAPDTDPLSHLRARIALLEERVDAQDAALRRVLTLMVDWVETDEPRARSTSSAFRDVASWPDAA